MQAEMEKYVAAEPTSTLRPTSTYIVNFKKRYGFSTRVVTHKAQENNKHPDDQWMELVKWIISFNSIANKFPKGRLYNADEVPFWMDAASNKTVDVKGSKTVDVVTTGHDKCRFTVVCTTRADGKMLKPYIIFKGLTKVPACCSVIKEAVIRVSNSGSIDGAMFEDFINSIIKPDMDAMELNLDKEWHYKRACLMFDRASAHLVDYVALELEELQIDTVPILAGQTSSIQPIDVACNSVSKGGFKEDWRDEMRKHPEFTTGGNRKKFPYDLLVQMVIKTFSRLSKSVIINSFITCGLNHHEDNLQGHEYIS
jgi:hypothetical protein